MAAATAITAPALALASQGYVAVPLQTSGVGHFHIAGRIAGQDVEVLLDTGASSTIIDRDFATAMGLTLRPLQMTGGGAGAGALTIWSVEGAELQIGSLALSDNTLLAMDFANIRAALAAKGVSAPQVILGGDVLRKRAAVIDYGSTTLWLKADSPR